MPSPPREDPAPLTPRSSTREPRLPVRRVDLREVASRLDVTPRSLLTALLGGDDGGVGGVGGVGVGVGVGDGGGDATAGNGGLSGSTSTTDVPLVAHPDDATGTIEEEEEEEEEEDDDDFDDDDE